MNYSQIEQIMLSYGLKKYEISEGTNFTYIKGDKHRLILERLKTLAQGGVRGFLYVKLLDEYKSLCSRNGHINVKGIRNEEELRDIIKKVIEALETSWTTSTI